MSFLRVLLAVFIVASLTANVAYAAETPMKANTVTTLQKEQPIRGLPATAKDIAEAKDKRKFVEDNYANLLKTFPDTVDMASTGRTFVRVRKGLYQEAKLTNSRYDLVLQLGVTSLVPADQRDTIIFKLVLPDGREIGAAEIGLDEESLWVQQFFVYPLQKLLPITVNVCFGVSEKVDPSTCILRVYDGNEHIDLKLNSYWENGRMQVKI
ncbi:hypothetical protein FOI68_20680 [Brevibacillus sp. LEMMJ03]|uniref:hypothetical protein n=1 Tax=Brevibacillus sp. LEMMJ03 TaxID=2595056 RepID=UPI00117CAA1A|nr:hypothetical protein [Brevibacillus sp. LEMMJ03]TRY23683.1 hypothetical protein FOI68_20680 [Brevibacillus sp. LEMMJ03]